MGGFVVCENTDRVTPLVPGLVIVFLLDDSDGIGDLQTLELIPTLVTRGGAAR